MSAGRIRGTHPQACLRGGASQGAGSGKVSSDRLGLGCPVRVGKSAAAAEKSAIVRVLRGEKLARSHFFLHRGPFRALWTRTIALFSARQPRISDSDSHNRTFLYREGRKLGGVGLRIRTRSVNRAEACSPTGVTRRLPRPLRPFPPCQRLPRPLRHRPLRPRHPQRRPLRRGSARRSRRQRRRPALSGPP